jgi:hypothetical protein
LRRISYVTLQPGEVEDTGVGVGAITAQAVSAWKEKEDAENGAEERKETEGGHRKSKCGEDKRE